MITLVLVGSFPSMNEIIAAAKKETNHYRPYAELKKIYTEVVEWTCKSQLKNIHLERVDLKIIWYCKDKKKDKDNIIAGEKFIIDGLVNAGIIPNDGWKNIGSITHEFDIDVRNPRVEVQITEV